MAFDRTTCVLCGKRMEPSDQTARIPSTNLLVHHLCLEREMGRPEKDY